MKEFGLSKSGRIKSKKEFNLIYSSGRTVFSESRRLKVVFYIRRDAENSFTKAAFTVHKKAGNAVWRNRVKRLLREAYRLNKKELIFKAGCKNIQLYMVFSANTINKRKFPQIFFADIEPEMINLMKKLIDII